jgi:hypothetical protein
LTEELIGSMGQESGQGIDEKGAWNYCISVSDTSPILFLDVRENLNIFLVKTLSASILILPRGT